MIEAAEADFKLDRKLDDGGSERDHLASAKRQIANLPGWKGKKAEEIKTESPEIPDALQYLWDWFRQHCKGLAQNGMGYPPVTWEGLTAWCGLTGVVLEPWEADVMVTLGVLQANTMNEKRRAESKAKKT